MKKGDILFELSIKKFHDMLNHKEITCAALVDYYLARIETYDEQINAVIQINPAARKQAQEKDRIFAEKGMSGALFGVPILLKDNIDTFDLPTTGGSKSLEGIIAAEDAFVVKKLREAGAIILAKVNLSEFACTGETRGSLVGQTKNPYDLTYTPGGSSGGTGAGLAANYALAGLGTDTMNSVRSPSSACSLVGLRPTRGLVSRSGVIPYALTHDAVGPLARSVEDAAIMLDAIAGYDSKDAVTAWSVGHTGGYRENLRAGAIKGCRLGIVRSLMGKEAVHQEVTDLMEQAFRDLADLGVELVDFDYHVDMDVLNKEVNVQFHEQARDVSAYLADVATQTGLADFAALLNGNKIDPWVKGKMQKALELAEDTEEYKRRLLNIANLKEKILDVMARQNITALVYPMQQQLVAKIGNQQAERNGLFCSSTGFPAVVVPAGFSKSNATAPLGLPVGIEFAGRPFSEKNLLQLAFAYEQATKHRIAPII